MANSSEDIGKAYIALWATLTAIATLFLLARLYVRIIVIRNWGYEDWAISVAGILNIFYLACGILQTNHGIGRHKEALSHEDATLAQKWQIIGVPTSLMVLTFVKLSICLLLHRIGISFQWKLVLWSLIGLYTIATFITIGLFLGRCSPVESLWDHSIPSKCLFPIVTFRDLNNVQIGLSLLTDFLLSLAPCIMLFKLQMKKNTKLILCGLFGLGIITTLASILKLYFILQFNDNNASTDFSFNIVNVSYWTFIECEIAMIGACIPTIRALFTKSSFFGYYRSSNTKPYGHSGALGIGGVASGGVIGINSGSYKSHVSSANRNIKLSSLRSQSEQIGSRLDIVEDDGRSESERGLVQGHGHALQRNMSGAVGGGGIMKITEIDVQDGDGSPYGDGRIEPWVRIESGQGAVENRSLH